MDWFTGITFPRYFIELHLPRQCTLICPKNRPPLFLLRDQETSTHIVYKTKVKEFGQAQKGLVETKEWLAEALPEIPCEIINTANVQNLERPL